MGDISNDFSWSWSRHRTFAECRRRYWLAHYAFWGGWAPETCDERTREIYIQKQLNTRPQWLGTVAHHAVFWVLRDACWGRFHTPERVVERYTRMARRQIDDSARGLYRANPKNFPGFDEHYYGTASDVDWEATVAQVATLVGNIFSNPIFLRLAQVPERIREMERLERLEVDGVPVWVSLDVLVEDGDGGMVVVDWKTGVAHDTSRIEGQLAVYAAYVLQRYYATEPTGAADAPLDRIQTMYANLRDNSQQIFAVDGAALERTLNTIRASAGAMRETLVDPQNNVGREDDFPMLPEGSELCVSCSYRRTCGRET